MRGVWPFGRVGKVSLLVRDTFAFGFLPLKNLAMKSSTLSPIVSASFNNGIDQGSGKRHGNRLAYSSHSGPSLSPAMHL